MVVLLHVIIALTSVAYTTGLFFRPSKRKLYTSYGLVGLTLASGAYLVVTTHAHMLQACTSGLIYIGSYWSVSSQLTSNLPTPTTKLINSGLLRLS